MEFNRDTLISYRTHASKQSQQGDIIGWDSLIGGSRESRDDLAPTEAIRRQYIIVTREPGEVPCSDRFYFGIYSIP